MSSMDIMRGCCVKRGLLLGGSNFSLYPLWLSMRLCISDGSLQASTLKLTFYLGKHHKGPGCSIHMRKARFLIQYNSPKKTGFKFENPSSGGPGLDRLIKDAFLFPG